MPPRGSRCKFLPGWNKAGPELELSQLRKRSFNAFQQRPWCYGGFLRLKPTGTRKSLILSLSQEKRSFAQLKLTNPDSASSYTVGTELKQEYFWEGTSNILKI